MIFLKGGIGAKLVLLLMGLGLGVGGVAAGARYHAAHQPTQANQRLFVGRVTAIAGDVVTVHGQGGATVRAQVISRTIIRHAGTPTTLASLHVGDTVLVRVYRQAGTDYALSIGQLKRAPTKQGP